MLLRETKLIFLATNQNQIQRCLLLHFDEHDTLPNKVFFCFVSTKVFSRTLLPKSQPNWPQKKMLKPPTKISLGWYKINYFLSSPKKNINKLKSTSYQTRMVHKNFVSGITHCIKERILKTNILRLQKHQNCFFGIYQKKKKLFFGLCKV